MAHTVGRPVAFPEADDQRLRFALTNELFNSLLVAILDPRKSRLAGTK
jgi:hypothetical protein